MVEEAMAAKFWPVSEITSTDQISAITSNELVRNEVDDRATISQKSSLPQVTRFVSDALMPDTSSSPTRMTSISRESSPTGCSRPYGAFNGKTPYEELREKL